MQLQHKLLCHMGKFWLFCIFIVLSIKATYKKLGYVVFFIYIFQTGESKSDRR